jgi:peroxiredoxin
MAQTCLVKVGDAMPEAKLPGLDGKQVGLHSLLGSKLTVVLFWQAENMYATQAMEYLEPDVVKPFGEKGVRVIGISVKDPANAARKAVEEAGAKYVNLLDPEGDYYAKVATDRIPRVYLLDPAGKVLWFDIEYSPSTQRDLERAIRFVLGEK